MSYGLINVSQKGDGPQPSPSLWRDCRNSLLNDLGLGHYRFHDFLGGVADTVALNEQRPGFGDSLALDCDDDTVLSFKAGEEGGYQKIATPAADNAAFALFGQTIGKVVRNSGNKLWFETRVELTTLADAALFVGVIDETGATRDAVADNPSNTLQAGLVAKSLIGFVSKQAASAVATVNAVYAKAAGSVVTVLADASNATAIAVADRSNLVAATEIKLGIRFNGITSLEFYVNGVKVATQDVDSTVDQSIEYAPVVAYKTGAAAAISASFDWVRYASQLRS